MRKVYHALMLNYHQPPGNLEHLLATEEWAAKELLWAIDRMPRALWEYEDVARVHLSMSGTLLETLSNPAFQERVYGFVKCGEMLWHLQNRRIFDVVGTGYYHPVLALIPPADREEQMARWLGIARHLFWRADFHGFWPPEMGFTMELIPLLKKLGYRYVMVDSNYVEPLQPMRWEELRYRPHVARYGGEEIIVVVRDRELSDAQQSGMDNGWFKSEVHERTKHCEFPPLVMSATDGDNGGWFRNTDEKANFWHVCYRPLLDWVRRGETEIEPIFIHDYLDRFGAHGEVNVRSGAWNTGWHHGADFMQWTGSDAQKQALARIQKVSDEFHKARAAALDSNPGGSGLLPWELNEAHWRLLRAETSCNLFWGEDWVGRAHADLDEVVRRLENWEQCKPVAESGIAPAHER
ncbi:MAG TPA: glycoside hydrolase family 57 [Verrucomicrobiota bacterium]|nr:glycoside hydrolase family 57 [Verrucomicrobiota bacterium]